MYYIFHLVYFSLFNETNILWKIEDRREYIILKTTREFICSRVLFLRPLKSAGIIIIPFP